VQPARAELGFGILGVVNALVAAVKATRGHIRLGTVVYDPF
jgi:hypothetical protein